MISLERARDELDRHLADSGKATHCRVVAHVMRGLATVRRQDADLWEIVGVCHDFDDVVTRRNRELHGIKTAEWLENDLPREALDAIRAHDHRTGVRADTEIADALKLADGLAIADADAGREALAGAGTDEELQLLSARLSRRPYLLPILTELSGKMNLGWGELVGLLDGAPRQHTG
ncbi:hypothetical protein [Microbaculum marinum]|uniref:Phosphohydrolase n=1 Tax=Microbaculum marinum TaxID=1764581 RepID=A0AAW9RJ58_9HYPH